MAVILLLAAFSVAGTLAQAVQGPYHPDPFVYEGCRTIDVSAFGDPVVCPGGSVTTDSCLAACQGHQFAALLPNACLCGDDAIAMTPIDESACDCPCMGDPSLGMCGSICPAEAPEIANVYCRSPAPAAPPASFETTALPVPPTAPSEDPCTSSTPISFAGPPPTEAPMTPQQAPPPPPVNSDKTPAETLCSSENTPVPGVPTDDPPVYPDQSPAPPAYPTPDGPPPPLTTASNPPANTGECPSPSVYSGPDGPEAGECGNTPESAPSESTLWPQPSATSNYGDPPVPSQVPGSDSTPGIVPPFSAIGGLVFIAAMMI